MEQAKQNQSHKYCAKTTEEHPLAQGYPSCLVPIGELARRDGLQGNSPLLSAREHVLDLDAVESSLRKVQPEPTMDICMGCSGRDEWGKRRTPRMLLVEFKFEVELKNLPKECDRMDKIQHSRELLGQEPMVSHEYYFLIKDTIYQQARHRMARRSEELKRTKNIIVASADHFYSKFFEETPR